MVKTWIEKRDAKKEHQIKINQKRFADMPAGIMMLIPTPKIIDDYIKEIHVGSFVNVKQLRREIASQYKADMSCPMVTGISLRIVSEASYEEYQKNMKLDQITPFWRAVDPDSNLAHKLTCGVNFIIENQIQEDISF
tara:strand:- start:327 stop:737 length:411 start_codon:yes stop_codon:yes gene_type:complete